MRRQRGAGLGRRERDVTDSLREMVGRGVNTLLVVTERDPGVDFVDQRWGAKMRRWASR